MTIHLLERLAGERLAALRDEAARDRILRPRPGMSGVFTMLRAGTRLAIGQPRSRVLHTGHAGCCA